MPHSIAAALERIAAIVGPRGVVAPEDAAPLLRDERGLYRGAAALVVRPGSVDECANVVRVCHDARIGVVPQGGNTGYCGGATPFDGERRQILLSLARLNRVREVDDVGFTMTTEAGVVLARAQEAARERGLKFPLSMGSEGSAQIGGALATNAGGLAVLRYGTMRDLVLGLSAVLADGSLIKTGGRARKSSAGYDLTRLLVGSEGTLGIITSLTLKLYGIPEAILSAVCPFTSIEGACNATIAALQVGLPLARIELADEVQIRACNAYSHLDLLAVPTLFLEFHGTAQSTREQVETFAGIARGEGGGEFRWAERPEDRSKLWQARHDAYWAARGLRPGAEVLSTDVCVPISALADCVTATRRDIDSLELLAPIVGHVGDGNFHVMPLIDPANPEERREIQGFLDRLIDRALGFGGTCTGEHGIGEGKISYLRTEHGPAVEVMIAIKKALDPLNILNPGKIFALA